MTVIPDPGQNDEASQVFNFAVGILDNSLEASFLPQGTGFEDLSTANIFEEAVSEGITFANISEDNVESVDDLSISENAKAYITTAVDDGMTVLVPTSEVKFGQTQMISWLEYDPTTGSLSGVFDNGIRSDISEEAENEAEDAILIATLNAELTALAEAESVTLAELAEELEALAETTEVPAPVPPEIPVPTPFEPPVPPIEPTAPPPAEPTAPPVEPITPPAEPTPPAGKPTPLPPRNPLPYLIKSLKPFMSAFAGFVGDSFNSLGDQGSASVAYQAAAALDILSQIEPPVLPFVSDVQLPALISTPNTQTADTNVGPRLGAGAVSNTVLLQNATFSGQLTASWQSSSTSNIGVTSLAASDAVIRNNKGGTVGSGAISLTIPYAGGVLISGDASYQVNGTGAVSFFGATATGTAVSTDWGSYTGTVSGSIQIVLTTSNLSLNRQLLPAGTYTITTDAATLVGNGACTSPNFSGSVSITRQTARSTWPREAARSWSATSPSMRTTRQRSTATPARFRFPQIATAPTRSRSTATRPTSLQVTTTPTTLTTDQNTPITFAANIQTSLAETYQRHGQRSGGLDGHDRQQRKRHRDARTGAPGRHVSDPDHRPIQTRFQPRGADDPRRNDHADPARDHIRSEARPGVHRPIQRRTTPHRLPRQRSRTSDRPQTPTT